VRELTIEAIERSDAAGRREIEIWRHGSIPDLAAPKAEAKERRRNVDTTALLYRSR
jgi:hypothetical protein